MISTHIRLSLLVHGQRRTVHPAVCPCGQWYYARAYTVARGRGGTCGHACKTLYTDSGRLFGPGAAHPGYMGATYAEYVTNGGRITLATWARMQVTAAVRRGELVRADTCENPWCYHGYKIEAHHHDYTRALDIQWLCACCHSTEHGFDVPCEGDSDPYEI